MKVKFATTNDLEQALEIVNKKYDGNVIFNRYPEHRGKNIIFTLKVKDSKQAGHRRGFSFGDKPAKRLACACWHVHGDFFDALLQQVNSNAVIAIGDKQIYTRGINDDSIEVIGNWEDRNIGSMMYPLYFSEACDCGKED